jgi:hypothetical protein
MVSLMFRQRVVGCATVFLLIGASFTRANELMKPSPKEVKAAVAKAIPLLWQGAKGHIAKKSCFACHNQATPLLALTTARTRGFKIPDEDVKEQASFIARFLDGNRENYKSGKGQGGQIDTAGYALLTLELAGWQPGETTAAVVEYMLLYQKDFDHWQSHSNRPPSEASHFTVNYLAIRGLEKWGTAEQKERIRKRIADSRAWLLKTPAKDTEDRVFRLLALRAADVAGKDWDAAVQDLLRTQKPDGGWSQLASMGSDAYATGTALTALCLAGGTRTTDPVYQRGLTFLLKDQLNDGSWHIKSRSKPFQTYYESGFPHGKDQFISMAASGWAVTALTLACPLDPALK